MEISINGEPTAGNHRPCGHCGKPDTKEGHDGCLGTLDESLVMNACCGHGNTDEAYIQFYDGSDLRGKRAIKAFEKLKKGSPKAPPHENDKPLS